MAKYIAIYNGDPYDYWIEKPSPEFKTPEAANIYGLNHYGYGSYDVIPVSEEKTA
jgi:hypothetical protein